MNKYRYLILILVAALPLVLSCSDDGPNSPGSEGSDETGVVIDIYVEQDDYPGEVDAYRILDCDGNGTADDPEEFTNEYGTATIDAQYTAESIIREESYKMYITRYTIEYSSDDKDAPPLKTKTIYKTVKFNTGSMSFPVDIADLNTKKEYRDHVAGGKYVPASPFPRYTITYTFYGQDQYGESIKVISTTPIKIGDYDRC